MAVSRLSAPDGKIVFPAWTIADGNSYSIGAVPAGSNRLLLVAVTVRFGSQDVTAINYGTSGSEATPMQLVGRFKGTLCHIWLYYLLEDDIAADNGGSIELSLERTSSSSQVYAASYAGVDQDNPFKDAIIKGDRISPSTVSADVEEVDGDATFAIAMFEQDGTSAAWTGLTEQEDEDPGTGRFTVADKLVTSTATNSISCTLTGDSPTESGMIAASIAASGTADTTAATDGITVNTSFSARKASTFAPAAGSNRLVLCLVGHEFNFSSADLTDSGAEAITLGGQSLTRFHEETALERGNLQNCAEVWYLDEAGIAAMSGSSVAITQTDGDDVDYRLICLNGVDQTNPFRDVQGLAGTRDGLLGCLTAHTNDWVFGLYVTTGVTLTQSWGGALATPTGSYLDNASDDPITGAYKKYTGSNTGVLEATHFNGTDKRTASILFSVAPASSGITETVGIASSTGSVAGSVTHSKTHDPVGLPGTTGEAIGVSTGVTVYVGIAGDTASAIGPVDHSKDYSAVGLPGSSGSALPVSTGSQTSVGIAGDTASAISLSGVSKSVGLGGVAETTASALSVTLTRILNLGLPETIATAFSLATATKDHGVGIAETTAEALTATATNDSMAGVYSAAAHQRRLRNWRLICPHF